MLAIYCSSVLYWKQMCVTCLSYPNVILSFMLSPINTSTLNIENNYKT